MADQVFTTQPQSSGPPQGNWMTLPTDYTFSSNYSPALAFLSTVDQLFVKQKKELLEIITGFETENRYEVRNAHDQLVYRAFENSSLAQRCCCGPVREFDMNIVDQQGANVMKLQRPLNCSGCLFYNCSHQVLEVQCPVDTSIGTVEQDFYLFTPSYSIKDASGQKLFTITGPCWTCSCCGSDVQFKIFSAADGSEIGMIAKKWVGFVKENFTDADNFGVSFPLHLDPKSKALILGATFLIDFLHFEQQHSNAQDLL